MDPCPTVAPFQGTFYPPARSSPYLPIVSVNFRPEYVPLLLTVYTVGVQVLSEPLIAFVDARDVYLVYDDE